MLEQINRQAGVSITHVPYKGMAQLVPDAWAASSAWRWSTPPVRSTA